MSYVEHGPRIFLANKHNSGMPLMYGDYVLPKKRLEGRLKLHDSCSDIRAWSPNSLENSRYFRELGEHESPAGKIIPFNVVIDNIMRFNSQAQNELLEVKKELQKYKSLKLTVKQEQQLQNLDDASNESLHNNPYTSEPLRNTLLNACKSGTAIPSNSCLSIHIPCERYFQSNIQNVPATRNQFCQSYSYPLNEFDVNSALNNYNLISPCRSSVKLLPPADYSEKASSCVEYIDVALQVEKETRDVEVQIDDQINKCLGKIATITAISQTSFTTKSSIEDSNATEQDKSSLQTNNHGEKDFECDTSYSECSQDIGSSSESNSDIAMDSDFNLHNGIHKGIIIQKDSEIIVLKNELCVRDAELEELRDTNKQLENLLKEKEDCLHSQHGNLKILREKLIKLDDERNYEVEDLKQKLYGYKYLMEQLKQELSEKCESCYLQSQEIEKLQDKLQGMEQEVKKSESYSTALIQLKNVVQEKDELKKQNYEQSCILADQEEYLKQLLKLIKEMSVTYNEQLEAKDILENLKTEIHDKNTKISQYEDQLLSVKREISEFFNSLKNALNNLEELNEGCDSVCTCTKCELDIGEESNSILYNINIIMTRFQSYKIESQNLLQQVGDLKHYIEVDRRQTHLNQDLENMNPEVTTERSSNLLNVNKSNVCGIEFHDNFNSINSGNTIYEETNSLDSHEVAKEYQNYIIKLSKMSNVDNVEKEVVEYFAYFLFKLCSLIQKLQVYTEIERPLLIKQTYYFYEILKDTQSAMNISEDVTVKTRLISNLYNQHKEEYKKYNVHIKHVPNDLLHAQNKINEFIETILYQLLNEMLYTVKKDLYDEKIDHAIEIHLKSCMDRINTALQGAGDQRIHIVETIEEQQKELQKKDIEIAELKSEVAKQLVRIGEGDCLNVEQSEQGAAVKEQLLNVTADLNKKDVLISKLEEQYYMLKNELFVYNEDCTALKKKNKNLENMRSKLMKTYHQSKRRSLIKNKQIKNLIHQTHELAEAKELKMTLEDKINHMGIKLMNLRSVNHDLDKRVMQANMIISKRDEAITNLKNSIDKNDHSVSQKITEYENTLGEKVHEIMKLEDEKKLLNDKVKSIESRLVEMNETILSLTEENDKINIINNMQEDLTKLDKNERKLKVELNNLKAQFLTDQNNNRKLDNNLDTFLRENETLKQCIEYWANENNELSSKLSNEMIVEKLKCKLCDFSNKIYERILTLKSRFDSEKNVSNKQVNNKFQDKYKYQHREMELSNDIVTKDLTRECADQGEEIKENEIEELETQQLKSDTRKERIFKCDSLTFEQFNSSDDNSLKMWYSVKYLENENNKNENETEKLLKEIEVNNAEVKHCKEAIKHLGQENADLRAVLKSQIEEYQHKLMLMKKNYDSSLNALCERHKANVEILQQQFEDNMKNERCFDSESWLQSLNMEELMELHARISAIITDKCNVIHMENESLHDNDVRNQFYTKTNEIEKTFQLSPINIYEKESSQNKIVSSIIKEDNSYLHNQWQFIGLGDTQKYLTVQTPDDKLNLEYHFGEQRVPDVENKYQKERQTEKIDSSFDKQRWNFINQCSAYHKLSNAYEYSRILHTD